MDLRMFLESPEALQHALALADHFVHAPTRSREHAIIARAVGTGEDFPALFGEGAIFGGQCVMFVHDDL
jgi:hypothetical protein